MGSELLVHQLHFIHRVLNVTLDGLTHEDSLVQPEPGGNCLNWVLGHIVATRNATLALLGRDLIWDAEQAAPYRRGAAPIAADGTGARPFEEIVAAFEASQATIVEALGELSDEDLVKPSDEETVGTALAGLVFHESYHLGQVGLLRRLAGKEGAIK